MQIVLLLSLFVALVFSHAALTSPPARNAAGTQDGDCEGLYCKKNYDWMSANKGAKEGDWTDAGTNACGAPEFIQPSPNVVATYQAGQQISITISINAFHDGYYEFRLCVPKMVTDMPPGTNQGMLDCLATAPLLKRVNPLPEGARATYKSMNPPTWTQAQRETRWRQNPEDGTRVANFREGASFALDYVLPADVQCDHCVLHWYWQSLNSWQDGPATTIATSTGERFWNCADIAITNPRGKAVGVMTGIIGGTSNPVPVPVPVSVPKSNPQPVPVPKSNPQPVPVPKPVPVPVQAPVSNAGSVIGIWYWTWSGAVSPPSGTTWGIAFNGQTDPDLALSDSQPKYNLLPGTKILSLGGGNAAGHWTSARLDKIIEYTSSGRFSAYKGISYDIEEGDAGLGAKFSQAFAVAKQKGFIVIVTVSHSAPYGFSDAGPLMRQIFADANVDYLSPQLYTTGNEPGNDYTESGGVQWTEYASSHAVIVPSIVLGSMYQDAVNFYAGKNVKLGGYVQWAQSGFNGGTSGPSTTGSTTGGVDTGDKRCGANWADANSKCGTACPSGTDAECGGNGKCFASLSTAPCDGGNKVPTPVPVPIPVSVPIPRPVVAPVPVSAPVTSGGCGDVKYGAGPSTWWIAVMAPAGGQLSIKCGNGGSRNCVYDQGWKRWTCALSEGGECTYPHIAVVSGSECPLDRSIVSNAGETGSVTETGGATEGSTSTQGTTTTSTTSTGSSSSGDSGIPGWAVALLVIGSIMVVVLFVALIFLLKGSSPASRERY